MLNLKRFFLSLALLLAATPSFAAVALGYSTWTIGTAGATTVTSTSGTTQVSGSTFVAYVTYRNATNGGVVATTITDSKSNTYTLGQSYNFAFGSAESAMYYCINCVGGTAHTFTASGWTNPADLLSVAFVEFTGVGAGSIGSTPAGVQDTAASPIVAPSITTAVANEVVVNAFTTLGANTNTIADSGVGFTIIQKQQVNTGANGAISWAMPASSGTAAADSFSYSTFDYTGALAISIKPFVAVVVNGVFMSNGHPVKSGSSLLYK